MKTTKNLIQAIKEKRFDFNKDLGRLREWYKHDIIVVPLFNIYGSLLGYTIEVKGENKEITYYKDNRIEIKQMLKF